MCCLFSSSTGGISDNPMNFPTLGDSSIEEQGDKGNTGREKDGNRCRLRSVTQQTMYLSINYGAVHYFPRSQPVPEDLPL